MTEYLFEEIEALSEKVKKSEIPEDLHKRMEQMISRLSRMAKLGGYSAEYELVSSYINWVTSIPWGKKTRDNLSLERAKEVLDKHHYGLDDVKERILEYLAQMTLRENLEQAKKGMESYHAPTLCLVGLQGIGKTTVAKSIAEALGRKFVRIPLGGIGSILEIRGKSKAFEGAEPGQVIKALIKSEVMNPLILLDEIDKASGSESLRADIMAVLLEILDPEQNFSFRDHYIDYPVDLSKVLFICSANNTGTLSAALLDRLEVVHMPAYTDDQKEHIARYYLLPKIIATSGLTNDQFEVENDVWPKLIRPLGFDSGIRTLSRLLESIVRKAGKEIVEGRSTKVTITSDNYKDYLPKW